MTIHEPLTFASDLLISALAGALGWRLLRRDAAAGAAGAPARTWAWALLATAVGAAGGGLWHAIAPEIPLALSKPLWTLSLAAIGVASAALLVATARALLGERSRRLLVALALVQLALYLLWITTHDDFLFVIVDYGSAMLVVLGLHLWALVRRRAPGARRIAEAVVLSLAAAAIQQSSLRLGPLDHNVLYHLVQLGAFVLFYLGARDQGRGPATRAAG